MAVDPLLLCNSVVLVVLLIRVNSAMEVLWREFDRQADEPCARSLRLARDVKTALAGRHVLRAGRRLIRALRREGMPR
jgi:hypothetical protein